MRTLLCGMLATSLAGAQSRPVAVRIDSGVAAIGTELIALRHDLHQHPELSGQEQRTARVVADRLRALGLEVRTGVGGYGVVGVLRGDRPGPLVAWRADMDAVASSAPDPSPVKSLTPGVRHICGHDLHVTVALGLATVLAGMRTELPGSVMFIFQPDEERARGARGMLDAGLFASQRPVAIYGIHTAPLETGLIASRPGRMMDANGVAPGVLNDTALFASAKASVTRALGAAAFVDLAAPPAGFSEDFGHYQAEVPGVFFFVGASRGASGVVAAPHSPAFNLDDGAIRVALRAMLAVVIDRLAGAPR
jgi:metal-dependent amidase/aminoacylase/carboxypeptidase family protein